jgi:hypothetical protein
MEWSAIITIYLAVGAPFAAARWLRADPAETGWRRSGAAVLAAIVWPYIGLRSAERLSVLSREAAPPKADPEN